MSAGGRIAVFLDRDGVILPERPGYLLTPEALAPLSGALDAMRRLHEAGLLTVLITNQSPVGRGLLTLAELEVIHERLSILVRGAGGDLDGVFACPHLPDAGCRCRKPQPGLLLEAGRTLGLDLPASYMVGDQASDIEAGLAAGCRPILVLSGQTSAAQAATLVGGFRVAGDLGAAVDLILAEVAQEVTPRARNTSWPGR